MVSELKWIKTEDCFPPEGEWVLTTRNDWQKSYEIKCYMGKRINQYSSKETNWEWKDYEYDAWTSGHGDIGEKAPRYWAKLPETRYDYSKGLVFEFEE